MTASHGVLFLVCLVLQLSMADRKKYVQVLRRGAKTHQIERVADNAARDRVKAMALALLDHNDLIDEEREEMEEAWKAYKNSYDDWVDSADDNVDGAPGGGEQGGKEQTWFFSAAQLTYNCTSGDWCSKDKTVLSALFDRFKLFLVTVLGPLRSQGISATMERSTKADTHVHLHAYFHLSEPFRGQGSAALAPFEFETIRPHIETNTARGPAYKAAVNRGHYYVVVDKIGSLDAWTNYAPFEAYGSFAFVSAIAGSS